MSSIGDGAFGALGKLHNWNLAKKRLARFDATKPLYSPEKLSSLNSPSNNITEIVLDMDSMTGAWTELQQHNLNCESLTKSVEVRVGRLHRLRSD